jgi:hypothetical protein
MANKDGRGGRGLGARLRYEFDKSMAAGPIALIGWLAVRWPSARPCGRA